MKHKAIFLDRDGTICKSAKPHTYIRHLADLKKRMFKHIEDDLSDLKCQGYLVVVVTNQAGLDKNLINPFEYFRMNRYLKTLGIDRIYTCPHDYTVRKCHCRKPASGLLQEAITELDIDPKKSWMIGDSDTDMMAGGEVGCHLFKGKLSDFMEFQNG